MKNNGKVLVAIAAIVAVLGWWLYSRRSAQDNVIDLVATFPQAEHRSKATPSESALPGGQRHHRRRRRAGRFLRSRLPGSRTR